MSSQQQSEALLAAARDAVIVVDDTRTFVDVNPAASRLLGVPAPDLLGRRVDDFLEPGVNLEARWQSFLDSGEQTGELRMIRPDGEVRHVEYTATARPYSASAAAFTSRRRTSASRRSARCSSSGRSRTSRHPGRRSKGSRVSNENTTERARLCTWANMRPPARAVSSSVAKYARQASGMKRELNMPHVTGTPVSTARSRSRAR